MENNIKHFVYSKDEYASLVEYLKGHDCDLLSAVIEVRISGSDSRINRAIKKRLKSKINLRTRDVYNALFTVPYDELPTLIGNPNDEIRKIASWRLLIGK